jgi:hypothetical protein
MSEIAEIVNGSLDSSLGGVGRQVPSGGGVHDLTNTLLSARTGAMLRPQQRWARHARSPEHRIRWHLSAAPPKTREIEVSGYRSRSAKTRWIRSIGHVVSMIAGIGLPAHSRAVSW